MRRLYFSVLLLLLYSNLLGQLNLSPEQLLSEYVQIKSVSGDEAPAARFFLNKCKEARLHTFVFSDEPNSFNFAASLYPLESGKPNIVFHTHCDVVFEGDSSKWTYPPYSGTIADGQVWGRGAIDNKALGVMQLMALQKYTARAENEDLPYNVSILVVSNEEQGGKLGAGRVVNNFLDLLNPVVVYGEGGAGLKNVLLTNPEQTVYGISVIHKQGIWLDLSLKNGGSAHGAIASDHNINNQLVSALHRLMHQHRKIKVTEASSLMVHELSNYEKGMIKCAYRHPKLFFPLVKKRILNDPLLSLIFTDTYNCTNINSPYSSMNSVPHEVHAILDCRFLEPTQANDIMARISKKAKCPELDIQVLKESPPADYTKPDKFYSWLSESIVQNEPDAIVVPILFPAIADNNYFRNKGIPTYGLVPCYLDSNDVKSIHNINEHISVSCLNQGINIYSKLIGLALNETK